MPNNIIKSFADKTGKSEEEIESLWRKIEKSVMKGGTKKSDPSFYPKIVAGLKRGLKITEERRMKTFKEFVDGQSKSIEELSCLLYLSSEDNNSDLNELNIKNVIRKANIRFKNEVSIIDNLKSGGKHVKNLMVHGIKAFSGDEKSKEIVKQIAKSEVSKEQIFEFLFKLDDATLHVITGPLHTIAALTGWDIIHELTKRKNKEVQKDKDTPTKFDVKNILVNLKHSISNFPNNQRRRALVFVDKLQKTLKIGSAIA